MSGDVYDSNWGKKVIFIETMSVHVRSGTQL